MSRETLYEKGNIIYEVISPVISRTSLLCANYLLRAYFLVALPIDALHLTIAYMQLLVLLVKRMCLIRSEIHAGGE